MRDSPFVREHLPDEASQLPQDLGHISQVPGCSLQDLSRGTLNLVFKRTRLYREAACEGGTRVTHRHHLVIRATAAAHDDLLNQLLGEPLQLLLGEHDLTELVPHTLRLLVHLRF